MSQAIYITMAELKKAGACRSGLRMLRNKTNLVESCKIAEEVRIPLKLVLETNGAVDVEFCLDALDSYADDVDMDGIWPIITKANTRAGREASRLHPWPKPPDGSLEHGTPVYAAYHRLWDAASAAQDKAYDKLMAVEMKAILKGLKRA